MKLLASGDTYIRERLDRAVANVEWRGLFPLVHVKNGDPYHSDHRPVIIDTDSHRPWQRGHREGNSFRFEANWLQEEDCAKVVEESWDLGDVGWRKFKLKIEGGGSQSGKLKLKCSR